MKLQEAIAKYYDYRTKLKALRYVDYLISWDTETEAPAGCLEERSKQVGVISEMGYKLERSEEYIEILTFLHQNIDQLDEILKIEIKKTYKELQQSLKIPMEELIEFSILMSKSANIWANAKINNDYNLFKDTLKQIIDFTKKQLNIWKLMN